MHAALANVTGDHALLMFFTQLGMSKTISKPLFVNWQPELSTRFYPLMVNLSSCFAGCKLSYAVFVTFL